jgi:DNA-binding transcriptional MerR regulator
MGRPSIRTWKYMTTTKVAKALGMDGSTLIRWLDEGVLPEPPKMEGTTRLFDQEWLIEARKTAKELSRGRKA